MNHAYNLNKETNKIIISSKSLIILSLTAILFLSGCSKYQYMFVGSNLPRNDNQEYIMENDTIQVKYSFSGRDFPVSITLYNKLLQPLYIDLERSTIVINDVQVNKAFYRDGQVSYIAPLSSATITSNPLMNKFITLDPQDSSIDKLTSSNLGIIYSYNGDKSPVKFRSILALTVNEDNSYPTFFDYSFWISDIIQTMGGPRSIPYKPANQFYIKKITGAGKTMAWTGGISLLLLGAYYGSIEPSGVNEE